jgi:hypothetical protein
MDIEDQIPPSLPLPSGSETALGRRQKGGIPLFGKEGLATVLFVKREMSIFNRRLSHISKVHLKL